VLSMHRNLPKIIEDVQSVIPVIDHSTSQCNDKRVIHFRNQAFKNLGHLASIQGSRQHEIYCEYPNFDQNTDIIIGSCQLK
jgi:hypothetical protein